MLEALNIDIQAKLSQVGNSGDQELITAANHITVLINAVGANGAVATTQALDRLDTNALQQLYQKLKINKNGDNKITLLAKQFYATDFTVLARKDTMMKYLKEAESGAMDKSVKYMVYEQFYNDDWGMGWAALENEVNRIIQGRIANTSHTAGYQQGVAAAKAAAKAAAGPAAGAAEVAPEN